MFKKGDKVIAKKDIIFDAMYFGCYPILKGNVYVIRNTDICAESHDLCLRFEDLVNLYNPVGDEYAYPAYNFEKLVSDEELNDYKNKVSIPELENLIFIELNNCELHQYTNKPVKLKER